MCKCSSDNSDNEYTIGQAAELLGVTTRTLRHWDTIGLLSPQYRTWSDYRLYTEDDIDSALEILVYRSAGVPLKEIENIIHADSSASRRQRLLTQRDLLTERIAELRRMIRALETLLKEDTTMDAKRKTDLFDREWKTYQAEAEERWGDTAEWEQATRTQQAMTSQDWDDAKTELRDFVAALSDAAACGITPGSAEAADLVERHLASITRWYEAGREKQVLLARMYVADKRFDETYGGNAQYLLELVEAQARAEGIDPDMAQWR